MTLVGKAHYRPAKGYEEKYHIIGEGDNPIMVLKKKDIAGLFTREFYRILHLWKLRHFKWDLPDGLNIDNIDPFILECLISIDAHYNQEFSDSAVTRKYLEAIIKRMDAGGGI